jgi:hypothetical protein
VGFDQLKIHAALSQVAAGQTIEVVAGISGHQRASSDVAPRRVPIHNTGVHMPTQSAEERSRASLAFLKEQALLAWVGQPAHG